MVTAGMVGVFVAAFEIILEPRGEVILMMTHLHLDAPAASMFQ